MILVFGSLNADYVFSVPRLPKPGETLSASEMVVLPGGKGANQALAARRAGAQVAMIGAVGDDSSAEVSLSGLRAAGVDLSGVKVSSAATGIASINLDPAGENAITVFAGANADVSADQVTLDMIGPETVLVFQMEVPANEIYQLTLRAADAGAKSVLNLAPAQPIELDALNRIDFLIVNAGELSMLMSLLGRPAASQVDEMLVTAGRFTGGSVIVTLGPDGARSYHQGEISSTPSPTIDVVDTVGAGDAFVGVFAAAIEQNLSFNDAVRRGCVAGALACQKIGAQSSLPDAAAIEAML